MARQRPGVWRREAGLPSQSETSFAQVRSLQALRRADLRLAVIAAPAGSGKSVLLDQVEVAWRSEGRPVRRPAEGEALKPCLPGETLLIDDFDKLEPDTREFYLAEIAKAPAAGLHVVASRRAPAMDWMSLELSGRAALITGQDLRLSESETAQFLESRAPGLFNVAEVSRLHQKTAGWMVALNAVVMTARRLPPGVPRNAQAVFPAARIDAYLEANLAGSLPHASWDLIRRLSALDQFNVDLVEDVFGHGAVREVQQLEDEFGLLAPAGGAGDFLELLRPVRDYLRRNHRLPRDEEAAALKKASQWCISQGAYERAIEYLIRAQKPAAAAKLLTTHAQRMLARTGDTPRMLEWLDQIVRLGGELGTDLRLWRAWSLVSSSRVKEAEEDLAKIDRELRPDDVHGQSFAERLRVSIAARRGDLGAVETLGEAWLARWASRDCSHAPGVSLLLALAAAHRSNERGYRRLLLLARQYAAQSQNDAGNLWVLGVEAIGELEAGRAQYAAEVIDRAQTMADQTGGRDTPVFGMLGVIAARVHLELGDMDAVRRNLAAGYHQTRYYGVTETHLAAQEAMIGYTEIVAGADTALLNLHQPGIGGRFYTVAGHLLGVRVLLRAGRVRDATHRFEGVMDTLQGFEEDEALLREARTTEAWLRHAQGDHEGARALLLPQLAYADAHGQRRRLCSLLLLRAACEAGLGDRRSSRRCLSRGIGIASAGRLVRTVLDLSWALRDVLSGTDGEEGISPEADKFLHMISLRMGIETSAGDKSRIARDQFTKRELNVISLLDTPLRGMEIADRLEMSETTFKWHLRNIYGKMEVKNRAGAVSLARRASLI